MPLNGDKPGVLTVGAAQILRKTVLIHPASVGWFCPLFYLVVCQMLKQGEPPKTPLETQSKIDIFKAYRPATQSDNNNVSFKRCRNVC